MKLYDNSLGGKELREVQYQSICYQFRMYLNVASG
jgi:hypothetical protein